MIERVLQTAAAFDTMTPLKNATLADKLSGERHRWFIGRQTELQAFDSALADSTCSLLFLSGATGIGKSILLQELERHCRERGHSVASLDVTSLVSVDGHPIDLHRAPSPVLTTTRGLRPVVLVDSYELLANREQELLSQLVQTLPVDALLIIASRKRPPQWLLIDPAWSRLARFHELAPWTDDEAVSFLETQNVALGIQPAILRVAGGYPLALSVAAQIVRASHGDSFGRDEIRELQAGLGQLIPFRVSSRTQHVALDLCVLVRDTSVELLDHVLRSDAECDADGAEEAFEWLAGQPFIERHNHLLRPHALARLTMLARARREQKSPSIFRAVREFYVNELAKGSQADADLDELFFIDRDFDVIREQDLSAIDVPALTPAREADQPGIIALVRHHAGDENAKWCQHWLSAAPGSFEVARANGLQGVLQVTRFSSAGDIPLSDSDPAAVLVESFVTKHPLEEGAVAVFFRWFMDRVDFQTPTARVFALTARQTQVIIALPRVQYSLCVFRAPEDWSALWDSAHSTYEVVGTFDLDGQRYSLIAFSFEQQTLRQSIVEAYRVAPPSPPASERVPVSAPAPAIDTNDSRGSLEQRVAALARQSRLSARESEVLQLLCLGRSYEEIAQDLRITARTVRFHQGNVFRKLGATSRIDIFRQLI